MNKDSKNLVLNKIREINKEKPAQQGELMNAFNLTPDDIVLILNTLNDQGEITCRTKTRNKSRNNKHLKFLDLGDITANSR